MFKCDLCGHTAHVIRCGICDQNVCESCASDYDPDPPGRAICRACVGLCPTCRGEGEVLVDFSDGSSHQTRREVCARCSGSGKRPLTVPRRAF